MVLVVFNFHARLVEYVFFWRFFMSDRRRSRVFVTKGVTLSSGRLSCGATILNISLKGALLKVGDVKEFPEGSSISVAIHLEPGNPEFDIKVKGCVVRHKKNILALDFTEVNSDSFQHLIRFVKYNSEDPEGVDAEISTMAFE
jgi:hypothetical protein